MKTDAEFLTLQSDEGLPKALIVAYGQEPTQRLLDAWRKDPTLAPKGKLSESVVDQLTKVAALAPAIQNGLSNGSLFQVIGSPALIQGIQNGSLALMQTASGTLGTVVSTTTGHISGNLTFAATSGMPPVVVPAVAYTVLNAIAGVYQLQRINQSLDKLSRALIRSSHRAEATVLGEVQGSVSVLEEIYQRARVDWTISMHDRNRLANAEQQIRACFHRYKILIQEFSQNAASAMQQHGADGLEASSELLREEGSTLISDAHILAYLCRAQSSIDELHLLIDISENPAVVGRQIDIIAQNQRRHADILANLPQLRSLFRHASRCEGEIHQFLRWSVNRGQIKRLRELEQDSRLQVTIPGYQEAERITSYCFWRDSNGLNVCASTAQLAGP